jgi:peptidoglycan/LPS O-acetylase OafA/YrhL
MLACSVVLGHSGGGSIFTGPASAVQTFYIISGFYIALILQRTSAYKSKMAFYSNRYLRLFPVYIVIAVLAFGAKLVIVID